MRRASAGRAALEGVRAATRRFAPSPRPRTFRGQAATQSVGQRTAAVRSELRRVRPI